MYVNLPLILFIRIHLFVHRVKQSYLIERNSINVDSLNQKWQLKLRMDGICANTGIN